MSTAYQQEKPAPFIAMSGRQLAGTMGVGVVAGLLGWGLALLLDTYVFQGLFCQATITQQCASTTQYATTTAAILSTAIAVFALVKLQVFRPLLVGVSVAASLWGVASTLALLPWYGAMLASIGTTALAYVAFMWAARFRSFLMSVVIMVVIVVAVRLALNS
jgi:hypothetical protein